MLVKAGNTCQNVLPNMEKIPFKVSSRAGKLLGRENFSNPNGAVLELVKNAYDADANNCVLILDTPNSDNENSCLYIIDDGEGMDRKIIENFWMTIGTGHKENTPMSSSQRVRTGAKGIGRFALDRLGKRTSMWTYRKKSRLQWRMNWELFDAPDKHISEIDAELDNISQTRTQIIDGILNCYDLPNESVNRKAKEGTIIKIEFLKDVWDKFEIARLFKDLEELVPPKDIEIPFKVNFYHIQSTNSYGEVETAYFDDYDYKLKSRYDAKEGVVTIDFERNELDIEKVKQKFSSLYKGDKFPYNLTTLSKKSFTVEYDVYSILEIDPNDNTDSLLKRLGSFGFTFYYLKKRNSSKEGYPYKMIHPSSRQNILDRFGGVKIYRDSFRVRPYGDPNNDWLKLGARAASSPASAGQRIGDWRVRPESTAGIVTISRYTNSELVDKSDRGALQENEVFELFKNLLIGIIHQFERDRSVVLHPIYKFLKAEKKRKKQIEVERRANELAKKIVSGKDKGTKAGNQKSIAKHIQEDLEEHEFGDSKTDRDEIMEIRTLASLGLIVSSFAHELKEIRNHSYEIIELEKVFRKLSSSTKLNPVLFNDGIEIIDLLKQNSVKVQHWVNYALTAIQTDKRKRKNINLNDFLESLRSKWQAILDSHNIDLRIKVPETIKDKFRAFPMDMETIFSNLITNSIEAFQKTKSKGKRSIHIVYEFTDSDLMIKYRDNGCGLSSSFATPDKIFEPFTTTKKDRKGNPIGYGLGMYLVKDVVDNYNGKISVENRKNGFSLTIIFPLRKK